MIGSPSLKLDTKFKAGGERCDNCRDRRSHPIKTSHPMVPSSVIKPACLLRSAYSIEMSWPVKSRRRPAGAGSLDVLSQPVRSLGG